MKLCQNHWDELVQAIKDRGLSKLNSTTSKEAMRRMVDSVGEQAITASNFDPLINANMAIWSNSIEVVGLEILQLEGCPVCFLIENCGCGSDDCEYRKWVGYAADDQVVEAKKHGFVGDR